MPTQLTLQLSVHDLLIWLLVGLVGLVGLVAGLLASRVMLGGGLGLIGDCISESSARWSDGSWPSGSESTS